MKTCLRLFLVLCLIRPAAALDVRDLEPIGAVRSWSQDAGGVTFQCEGGSALRVAWLAPDLVRVRAALGGPFPVDHSWAVAKTDWPAVPFTVEESSGRVLLKGAEMRVLVERKPLRVEFQDGRGRTLNRDHLPMMWDAQGKRRQELFDPKSGPMVAVTKDIGQEEHFYGLGEKATRLDKRRGSFTMWNSDTPHYVEGQDPIYQSIPFYIGLQDNRAYGIFFDNSHKTYFDFGNSTPEWAGFAAEGGGIDYYFFAGPAMPRVLERYTELTGRMPLPPRWALGHQACRWSYFPEKMVEDIAATYQAHDLPLDVMTLDIDYMQKYRVFTWDLTRFPDPAAMVARLLKKGLQVVTIIDPGVKYQPTDKPRSVGMKPELEDQSSSYYVYNQGLAQRFFVSGADGKPIISKVWPGEAVFVDFTQEAARRWWGDLHRALLDHGVGGIWNDMNEPADFVDQTGANLREGVHEDGGQKTRHAKNRNLVALLMARATFEGMSRLRPQERPYVITRAAYAGIQRYSTMWTGDASTSWEGLALSLPMFTTLGLSGESFIGSDVGGFMGRGDGEILTRAYQICFVMPFCRNHKEISGYDQEPWRFGPYYEGIIRRYLKLRYRLLPYLYARLDEAHRTGLPPVRPLLLHYQADPHTWTMDDEFLLGRDLLLAPVCRPAQERRRVYLPAGLWYDFWTGRPFAGERTYVVNAPLETVPMFVRGGAILPLGPEKNTTAVAPNEPLELRWYPDAQGSARGTLYDDDGHSTGYLQGRSARRQVECKTVGQVARVVLGAPQGSFTLPRRPLELVWKGCPAPRAARWDGRPVRVCYPSACEGLSRRQGSAWVSGIDDGKAHTIELLFAGK